MDRPGLEFVFHCARYRRKAGRFWLRVIDLFWLKGAVSPPSAPALR